MEIIVRKIGKNENIGHATLERASVFSENLEKFARIPELKTGDSFRKY